MTVVEARGSPRSKQELRSQEKIEKKICTLFLHCINRIRHCGCPENSGMDRKKNEGYFQIEKIHIA